MYDICSMLTKKQKNLLLFINKKLRSSGVSPSYEEMKQSLNLKSKSGIHRLISALEERGFIRRLPHKARALEVIKLPETASANDIYNSFSPSVIKGGLDKNTSNEKSSEISEPSFIEFPSSKPPLIMLGEKLLYISLADAVSGSFITSKALALCASLLINPLSSKALINL